MIDYANDNDGDLQITGGDFVKQESTRQHQNDLFFSSKGDYKLNPTIGVDPQQYIDDEDPAGLISAVNTEFLRDGMQPDTDINGKSVPMALILADLKLQLTGHY